MQILLVEDEPKVAQFIQFGLEEAGYEVTVVYDGMMGKKLAVKNTFDLIILDLVIPFMNGLELCKSIREVNQSVPILMLTALGTTADKVSGLEAGADDYMVKPFEFSELLARINSLKRRTKGVQQASKFIKVSNLTLNYDTQEANRGGKDIRLTAKEFALLEYLMRHKGRVIKREELAEKIWDIHFDTGTNVVDVYVNLLRKKIDKDYEPKLIQTRIGMGYILND